MNTGINDDQFVANRAIREQSAPGPGLRQRTDDAGFPADVDSGWDGFYNIRGNVGMMDLTQWQDFVVVDFTTNTPSFSPGPMQNHNPQFQMIFRSDDIDSMGGLYV
jgi:hypothetical protein